MSVGCDIGVMKDWKLKMRDLHVSHAQETHVLFNFERSHDSIFIENREVVL
jgi:hypothetical protein